MTMTGVHEYLMYAAYFAPRGKKRLISLGRDISQRYLSPEDHIIGLIGDAGAGKSLLIRGMFPGLELTNDDDGINIRPLPLLADAEQDHFRAHTYHVDLRFEAAFTPLWEIAEAVKKACQSDRRVVIEHFELLYEHLGFNAEVLIGVGEEVLVTRPGLFGPFPAEIAPIVFKSLRYRKMAHSAEDLTSKVLEGMGLKKPQVHGDIKHGFILEFPEVPSIDLALVEQEVLAIIEQDIPIHYQDEFHIMVGAHTYECTGPRIHLRRTGEIENFRLVKDFKYDPRQKLYLMVGLVGDDAANHYFNKAYPERLQKAPDA